MSSFIKGLPKLPEIELEHAIVRLMSRADMRFAMKVREFDTNTYLCLKVLSELIDYGGEVEGLTLRETLDTDLGQLLLSVLQRAEVNKPRALRHIEEIGFGQTSREGDGSTGEEGCEPVAREKLSEAV